MQVTDENRNENTCQVLFIQMKNIYDRIPASKHIAHVICDHGRVCGVRTILLKIALQTLKPTFNNGGSAARRHIGSTVAFKLHAARRMNIFLDNIK